MALIPVEVKTALKILGSIDVSLGRIADALEKSNTMDIHYADNKPIEKGEKDD